MTKLFGVDIAKEIAKGMGAGLLPVTLIKVVPGSRDNTSMTAGNSPSTRRYPCRGILEDYKASEFDGTEVVRGDQKVLILGGTLPLGIVPEPNDKITIEGRTRTVASIPSRDPAGATYLCQVRG